MPDLLKLKNLLRRSFHNLMSARKESQCHLLLITTDSAICQSQIFPFYFHKERLLNELGVTYSEVDISEFENGGWNNKRKPDVVFFQPWFTISKDRLLFVFKKISSENPSAKIIFLDSYAPLDLRFAELTNPLIDVYVKKQLLRDRTQYGLSTIGDTNLANYYAKLYSLDLAPTTFNIPNGFLDKLVLGSGFDASERILPVVNRSFTLPKHKRSIDLHARLGGAGEGWYGEMRTHANRAVQELSGVTMLTGANIDHHRYIQEMKNSKICFSPFGFGEVCWRDYEAMMCGALLIKPDMSHVETHPHIFQPFKTYVPIEWDFSDLKDKVHYYLNNKKEREDIVSNAYALLRRSASGNDFLAYIAAVLKTAGLPISKAHNCE